MKRKVLEIDFTAVAPSPETVLSAIGYDAHRQPGAEVRHKLTEAMALLAKLALPQALLLDISSDQFAAIFEGEGQNDPAAPLHSIYPEATRLALFVATIGSEVTTACDEQFAADDTVLGVLLDAAASLAADESAAYLERELFPSANESSAAMRYSPGYCGWHVSGQHKLFATLEPADIGVTLRPSGLMQPLKSVSGVIVAGPKSIHRFRPEFDFCTDCKTKSCQSRIDQFE